MQARLRAAMSSPEGSKGGRRLLKLGLVEERTCCLEAALLGELPKLIIPSVETP